MHGVDSATAIAVPESITPESAAEFAYRFKEAASDDSCRVVVLLGRAGVFCRGMQPSSPDGLELRQHLQEFADCLLRMRFAAKPVLAVINGEAIGGGLGLAATADMVIASEPSTFGLPEALFGFVPAMILPLLLERMRPKDCRLWMLSGYSRPAHEAHAAGLVDTVCPEQDLERCMVQAIRQLSRPVPSAVSMVKRMTSRPGLEESVRAGVQVTMNMLADPEVSSAFLRFFEDGTLPWQTF